MAGLLPAASLILTPSKATFIYRTNSVGRVGKTYSDDTHTHTGRVIAIAGALFVAHRIKELIPWPFVVRACDQPAPSRAAGGALLPASYLPSYLAANLAVNLPAWLQ